MKKLLVFCLAAMVMAACNQPKEDTQVKEVEKCNFKVEADCRLPIAVVNIDTLYNNYNLAIEENERLMKKQEDIRLNLNQKLRSLQNEMVDFQKKLENNAFLSRERAEAEQRRLMKKEQDLQQLEQDKTQDMMIEQQNVGLRVQDSINSVIATLNASGTYHLIITTSALNNNVLFSAEGYDITDDVLELLNERYKN